MPSADQLKLVERQKKYSNIPAWHAAGITGKDVNVMNLESTPHGTKSCAERFLDAAPDATVYATGLTFDDAATCKYNGKEYTVEDFIREFKIKILIRSTGGKLVDEDKSKYWNGLKEKYNLIFVAPIGNNKVTSSFPADVAIQVGACSLSDKGAINVLTFSGKGEYLELVNFMGYLNGTSFSAPYTAGMIALLVQKYPDITQDEAFEYLKSHCKDIGKTGMDDESGYGIPIMGDPKEQIKPKEGDEMLNVIGNLVEHFNLNEMANNDDGGRLKITPEVVRQAQMMEELRKWYCKPMKVNSWYRTKEYNVSVGGDPNSCHLDGIATDIALTLTDSQRTNFINKWKAICKKWGVIGGVSIYNWGLHFDSNNTPTRYGKSNSNFRVTDFR